MEGEPRVKKDEFEKVLESSFWADSSDTDSTDEGIGSDESLDQSDQGSDGVPVPGQPKNPQPPVQPQQQEMGAGKATGRRLSVRRLVRLLRGQKVSGQGDSVVRVSSIQAPRVFGVMLTDHLVQAGALVPPVLEWCCTQIEAEEGRDGIYRLSGQASHIQALKQQFDNGEVPASLHSRDLHAVASLLKLYFRELPSSLLPAHLYSHLLLAARLSPLQRLRKVRQLVLGLPQAHLRTLAHLMRHLHRVSLAHRRTGMTSRNLAIVWAPNLLRAPDSASQDCLRDIGVQALVIETLILHYRTIFDPSTDHGLYTGEENEQEKEDEEERGVEGKGFTQEVSIDQAVARAEQKEEEGNRPRRPMVRSISCTRGLPGGFGVGGAFQRRGVTLRRDRSLQQDDLRGEEDEGARRRRREEENVRRQMGREAASSSVTSTPNPAHKPRMLPTVTRNVTFACTGVARHAGGGQVEAGRGREENRKEVEEEMGRGHMIARNDSRTRMKERLGWFASRGRLRLQRSFGSSDNLVRMREGLRRSRDRLTSALSPVRGRAGSYTLSDEGGAGECGSQLSSASSSSCYTVNRIGKEDNEDFRGSVTIRVTTGNGIPVGKDKEQEERRSRFEQEKKAVMRIYNTSFHTSSGAGRLINPSPRLGTGQEREGRERRRREGRKEKRERTGEGGREGGGGRKEEIKNGRYENVLFTGEQKPGAGDDASETVYDQVKLLRNSVREVNEIVQSEGEGRYKAVLIHIRGEEEEGGAEYYGAEEEQEGGRRGKKRREEETVVPLYDHPRPLGPRPVANLTSVSCSNIVGGGWKMSN